MSKIPDSLRRPYQILASQDGSLRKIYAQSSSLLAVQSIIRQYAPANVYVASIRDETLHLITSSSVVATQIRYRQRSIVSAVRRSGLTNSPTNIVSRLKVSVRPEQPESLAPVREPVPISTENARNLVTAAKYIEDDALRKALIRLSKRTD